MSLVLTRLIAKIQLAFLKFAVVFLPAPKPTVFNGKDSALDLCDAMAHFDVKRALIVTDPVLASLGVLDPLIERLQSHGIHAAIYNEVQPDPVYQVANDCLTSYRQQNCDAVLAVGGGSSIDVAKAVALAASNRCRPQDLIGVLKGKAPATPLFAIPTTAGTGSEVTVGAVLSDDTSHQKGLIIDPKVVPVMVALDAGIMSGMPPRITAETGMDALTHAIEAYVSTFATQETNQYARAAIRMILEHLPRAHADGQDMAAREAMALASHYAGLALNKAGLGYVHAIAHQLGAHYGLPHGYSNAIVLPHILAFNRQASQGDLAELAYFCSICPNTTTAADACDQFIQHIGQLIQQLNIDTTLPQMKQQDFDDIQVAAFKEAHGTYAVPRYMQAEECLGILRRIQSPA